MQADGLRTRRVRLGVVGAGLRGRMYAAAPDHDGPADRNMESN